MMSNLFFFFLINEIKAIQYYTTWQIYMDGWPAAMNGTMALHSLVRLLLIIFAVCPFVAFFFFFCYNTSAKRFVQFGIHSLRKMGEKYENLLTWSGIKGDFFSPQHRECLKMGIFFPEHREYQNVGEFFPLNTNNVKMWEILPPPEHK